MKRTNTEFQVTNVARKIHLLKALVENRSLLTVVLPDLSESVTSALIEVDSEYILLDELIPHSANLAFNPQTLFSVATKLKGIPIRFQSRVQASGSGEDGIIAHACSLPETVAYQQKRTDYRLHSRGAMRPSILVSAIEDRSPDGHEDSDLGSHGLEHVDSDCKIPTLEPVHELMAAVQVPEDRLALLGNPQLSNLSGKVTDISMGGANVEFSQLPDWAEQSKLISCTIELNDGPMLFTQARVCHIHRSIKGRKKILVFHAGLEFQSLNELNKKQLQQWIFNSERKRLRQ